MAVNLPPFWLHLAYTGNAKLLTLLPELTVKKLAFGTIAGPHRGVTADQKEFQIARALGPAILDPHGHFIERTGDHDSSRRAREYPFLSNSQGVPQSVAKYRAWMASAIRIQEDRDLAGDVHPPSFLVTPSRILRPSSSRNDLYRQLDSAEWVKVTTGPKWMGVSLAKEFVLDSGFRTALLNQLVDAPEAGIEGVVLRIFSQELPPFTGRQFLTDIREVVETLADVGLPVLTATSGMLGWLAMGWGASAFSAGWPRASWSNREPGTMSQPANPPEYYYERQLLREVPWRVHRQISSQPGYQACPCPHCITMGTTWNKDLARKHHVVAGAEAANLIAPLAIAARATRLRATVGTAIAFRDSLSSQLKADSNAGFLDDWARSI